MNNQIEIYQTNKGTEISVRLANQTIWLDAHAIANLFDVQRPAIVKHIQNIYKTEELAESSTCSVLEQVANDGKKRKMNLYNLDVIISVGYRVNSQKATKFRIWATQRLKDYFVEGYAINQKRLQERNLEIKYLKEGISILHRAIEYQAKNITDAGNLAGLLEQFSSGLLLLDDYDHETLDAKGNTSRNTVKISKEQFFVLINAMRTEFSSDVFGQAKDSSFDSSINQIYQTFGGMEMYPSLEEKAAMLLYLIVKNHSFIDGNKRIAAACFLYFLEQNALLYNLSGEAIISNEALASITLFIAVSKPDEMETVKKVMISILNRKQSKI
jgi:prophage maintenance system killer protein